MRTEDRVRELGITLPNLPHPAGTYVHSLQVGNLLFLSGKGARDESGVPMTGKVGENVTTQEACRHARAAGLLLIAAMKEAVKDLDRVKRIVKVFGMVNSTSTFADHPKVVNGCSDLFTEIFSDRGRHARSAVGVASLPGNMTVEIEAIVEVL